MILVPFLVGLLCGAGLMFIAGLCLVSVDPHPVMAAPFSLPIVTVMDRPGLEFQLDARHAVALHAVRGPNGSVLGVSCHTSSGAILDAQHRDVAVRRAMIGAPLSVDLIDHLPVGYVVEHQPWVVIP